MKAVFNTLDALQIRVESQIYSTEHPDDNEQGDYHKEKSFSRLHRVFGKGSLSNKEVDSVLREVHANFMGLAKELLVVEGTPEIDELQDLVNGTNGSSLNYSWVIS